MVSVSRLLRELKKHGQANLVGRSFGVIKLKTQAGKEYDFSLPRTERKTAQGHGGFDVRTDPNMDREQASARRDFTVNALFYDSREEHVMDYHGGLTDLNQQRLHPTSDAFIEDPLRVLRAMQFLSRFSFQSSEALVQRARSIVPTFSELSTERVRAEWLKWASQSRSPSRGLHFLRDSSWIQHFPELLPLSETPQDPIWHPEGNVFEHTCYVCDALASLDEWRSATEINHRILMFAALDTISAKRQPLKSPSSWRRRIISPGHEKQSGTRLATFLDRIHQAHSGTGSFSRHQPCFALTR